MVIKIVKQNQISFLLSETEISTISDCADLIDRIANFIEDNSDGNGTLEELISIDYNGCFCDFLYCLTEDTSTVEKSINQYINDSLEEE